MCLYALLIMVIKLAFCGNEQRAAKAWLYLMGGIGGVAFVIITVINFKMWMMP